MFNSARSLAEFHKNDLFLKKQENINYIIEVAKEGTNLLSKNIDYTILSAYQNYVIAALNIVSKNYNINFVSIYMQFKNSIINLLPKEQLIKTIEFLIKIAENF